MDENGLHKRKAIWNARGAALAGGIVAGLVAAWNYYYFEQVFAALLLFSIVFLPILISAFVLALAFQAGEKGWVQAKQSVPKLFHNRKIGLATPISLSAASHPEVHYRHSALGPRILRELQRVKKLHSHSARRRAA